MRKNLPLTHLLKVAVRICGSWLGLRMFEPRKGYVYMNRRRIFSRSFAKALAKRQDLFVTERKDSHLYVHRDRMTDSSSAPITFDGHLGEFYAVADKVISDGTTLLRHERLHVLWQAMLNVRRLRLPAAEVGVWRGGATYFIAAGLRSLCGKEVPVHAIDTFEGHPAEVLDPEWDRLQRKGGFGSTSAERVRTYLSGFPKVRVWKGEFGKVAGSLPECEFGLVHIDVDTYETTKRCLEYFCLRIAQGGIIVIDDYGAKKCPGVAQAVEESLGLLGLFQIWQMRTEQCVLIRH